MQVADQFWSESNQKIQVLLIGGAGFIGSHLLEYWLQKTLWTMVVVDKDLHKIQEIVNERLITICHDYSKLENLADLIQKSDLVISLAAICNPSLYITNPVDVIQSNYEQPSQLVRLCFAHQKRLIHFSSIEVLGRTLSGEMIRQGRELPSDIFVFDENSPMLLGPLKELRWSYAAAKQLLERLIFAYGQNSDWQWTLIRPFNFIGPRMDYIPGIDGQGIPRVLAQFIHSLLRSQPLPLVDGGHARRTFIDIDDAVAILHQIVIAPKISQAKIAHIGNPNNEVQISELAEIMQRLYVEIQQKKTPGVLNVDAQEFYGRGYADSDRRIPDLDWLLELPWVPKIDLETSLRRTMAWYFQHYGDVIQ